MPSRIDEAGHTKAFGYPVAEHWGGKPKWPEMARCRNGLDPERAVTNKFHSYLILILLILILRSCITSRYSCIYIPN